MDGTISTTAEHEVVITRVIEAPRRLVFNAWTQPQHIARWWGPRGFTTIHCDMDIRKGGLYRFGMRSPQGTEHWKRGLFRELIKPERIVFTFAWENADGSLGHELLTTVVFEEHGEKTKLTLRQSGFVSIEVRDSHMQGWTSTLERFDEYLATQRG